MGTPSGEQLLLADGDQQAVVTGVGAALRRYSAGGRELLDGFGEGEMAAAGRGQVLAPWPNRLEDGRYRFDGVEGRAPLDEPERRNAIHGLVRWLAWEVTERSAAAVTLRCPLAPQPAYPFSLALEVSYALGDGGLTVTARASAAGGAAVPFGIGFHPYLLPPAAGRVDGALLRLPAGRRLLLDERGLPAGGEAVEGTPYDFREGRPPGTLALDDCLTALAPAAAGEGWPAGAWAATLAGRPGGDGVALWASPAFPYLMCYTGDTLADPAARRRSVALEPMTCPPNALRTGEGLLRLEPGGSWEGSWGIRPLAGGRR